LIPPIASKTWFARIMMSVRLLLSRVVALGVLLGMGVAEVQACGGSLHIDVEESGVYALDFAAIVAAQPQFTDCASADLALTQRGKEVPIRIAGDSNGRFSAGSRIEWVGQELHGPQSWYDPYSTVNVYQLAALPGAHARMHEVAPATTQIPAPLQRMLHLEQENLLVRLNSHEMKPGDEPDVWQWVKLTPVDPQPFAFNFDLADVDVRDTRAGMIALTLDFRGVSNVAAAAGKAKPIDHVVEVSVNGKLSGDLRWDGRDEQRKIIEVPRAQLREKDNSITLHVPRRDVPGDASNFIVDAVMFNWIEIHYPARGDFDASAGALTASADGVIEVSATQAPELYAGDGSYQRMQPAATGHYRASMLHGIDYYAVTAAKRTPRIRGVAAPDLRAADPGYDYLIVAHPSLMDAIEPLARLHREQGLKVAVYNVDDVYDQFNGGIAHPAAIRDLVTWGTQHWTLKPRYLLLVGDASTDIHHDPRNGQLSGSSYQLTAQPPPAQVLQGGGFAEMKSYSYTDAQKRVSTRNLIPTWQFPTVDGQAASDNAFVTMTPGEFHPTLAVGRFPVVEPDDVRAIVAKTIEYINRPAAGGWRREVTFISTSELASFKQASDQFAAELDAQGFATKSIYTDATDRDVARYQQSRTTLRDNLDGGNLLVHFMGHGGSYIWRVGAMGDLFSLDDVSALKNAGRYPMVMAMTCFSAPFDNPTDDSIGERFLREADKGAVAVFASSWKNWPNPTYSRSLIQELLKPGNRIGDAIVAGKAKITERDFVEMYNLLGDPALVLAQPQGRIEFARSADRWDPRMVVRIPAADFGGVVDVDWIGAQGKVLTSVRYQARDTQFMLPIPALATAMRIYAADSRNGFTAFGGVSLLPPPPKATAAPAIDHGRTVPTPTPTQAQRVPPRIPHAPDPHDDLSHLDFESPPVRGADPTPKAKARAGH
jgi:Peptidase family C25